MRGAGLLTGLFSLFLWGMTVPAISFAEDEVNTRISRPAVFTVELFGKGVHYSINFDHSYNEAVVLGLGFGQSPTETHGGERTGSSAFLIPFYGRYHFIPEAGSPFVILSATILANPGSVKGTNSTIGGVEFPSTIILPTVGLGYEMRRKGGFVFRLTGYGITARKVNPWFGAAIGYSF